MGTCVSKCYPCCHPIPCNSSAGISQASAAAVHPHRPLPGPGPGAASASPTTTTTSSLSPVASTSLCASWSSSSAASTSSYLWRPRQHVLLPNAMSSTSREWDVVVLDPKSSDSDPISGRGSDKHYRLAAPTPTPKRARSVSPLSTRPPPPPGSYEQQQHKKMRQNTGRRSTTAIQREVVALAQARNKDKKKKTEVSQSQSWRRLEAKMSSSAHADSTAALAQVTPDDDLTNPIISMDCFIFL